MATNYESANVKCPFYKRNDTKKVCCEGLEEGSQIVVEYDSKNKFKEKIRKNCAENYKECEVYQMILQKYDRVR